ncbi:hypothetical protein V4S33_12935 [Enterococcus cecorum]
MASILWLKFLFMIPDFLMYLVAFVSYKVREQLRIPLIVKILLGLLVILATLWIIYVAHFGVNS